MTAPSVEQFRIRYALFRRHSLLGTVYSFLVFGLIDAYERKVSGLVDVSAAVENHQDGRPHRHCVYTFKGSGNPCTVSEPSFCDDWIPLGILISWFFDDADPVACFLRGVVLRRQVEDAESAGLGIKRDGLGVVRDGASLGGRLLPSGVLPLQFVRFLFCELCYRKDQVPGADIPCSKCVGAECSCGDHPEAVRLLFLVMAVEALTKRMRHLAVEQRASGGAKVLPNAALGVGEWLEEYGLSEHKSAFRALLVDTTRDLAVLNASAFDALLVGVNRYWVAQKPAVLGSSVPCLEEKQIVLLRGAWQALEGEAAHCAKWVDIHWLGRRELPVEFGDSDAMTRSNDDFFVDFQFF